MRHPHSEEYAAIVTKVGVVCHTRLEERGKEHREDATSRAPLIGGDYALLPRDLPLLASDHRLRGARRAFCPCGGECGACGSRSECSRSSAGRTLPFDARGGGPGDG